MWGVDQAVEQTRGTSSSNQNLRFDDRGCFIGGPAKSGTTLLVALLDGHPELLVFPQDTAYFATAVTKYEPRGRRAQFDYLTKESWSKVLFGNENRKRKHDYSGFPHRKFLETFEEVAFDPANEKRDLLVLMIESYAKVFDIPLDKIKRWVEKTPANRNYVSAIRQRFPNAKLLITMRDPRALLAAQIHLEKTRKTGRFSTYYVIAHWRTTAALAGQIRSGQLPGFVVPFEQLVADPEPMMQQICHYLEISYDPAIVLRPTKVGALWVGNSSVPGVEFSKISTEPVTRWHRELTPDEIGWVEWHCRDLMPEFGYEPRQSRRSLRHWIKPVTGERTHQFLKSRAYSLRDDLLRR
jgi:Sulfotransferase family